MKNCLAKLNAQLRAFDTSEVTDAAKVYASRGLEDKAANIAAVEDHLRNLRRQRSEIEALVLEEWKKRDPEAFAKDAEPPAPVEKPKPLFARAGQTTTEAFKAWFGASKVVDAEGKPLRVYHGTARPDRVGNVFKRSRATSGPMAFFTANPELASNYSKNKSDTSIANEDGAFNYEAWFKFKPKGARTAVNLDRAWWHLTGEERARIAELAPRVGRDYETGETIMLHPEGHKSGLGGYDQHIKEARGNHLAALVNEWLNSAALYDSEEEFMQVLQLAGMKGAEMDSPHATYPAVLPVYLAINNPLVTSQIPQNAIDALERAGKRTRRRELGTGDIWDKRSRYNGAEWVESLKADHAKGDNSYVWTSIPDWVTDTLKGLGYDGIHDIDGKAGTEHHDVWIPFREEQVKSATGNRGTFDASKKNILLRRGDTATPQGMQVADAKRALAKLILKSSIPIKVVQRVADLPFKAPDDAKGAYLNGRIYVVAENLASALDAEQTIARHEITHAGIDIAFGNDVKARERAFNDLLLKNPKLKAEAARWAEKYGAEDVKERVARGLTREQAQAEMRLEAKEEALAYFSQEGNEIKGWQSFVAAIQRGLRALGFTELANWLETRSSAEVLDFLSQMRERTEAKANRAAARTVPAFQRSDDNAPTVGATAPLWYSDLAAGVAALKQESAPAAQWKATIASLKGVKRDEIEWSGVNEWLDTQGGKVTRAAINDYLAQNGVKVEETMLGEFGGKEKAATSERDALKVELDALGYDLDMGIDPNTEEDVISGLSNRSTGSSFGFMPDVGWRNLEGEDVGRTMPARVREIGERLAQLESDIPTRESAGSTRYSGYQLPGGENYRELLLTLPERDAKLQLPKGWRLKAETNHNPPVDGWMLYDNEGEAVAWSRTKEGAMRDGGGWAKPAGADAHANFRSSHFDQPNILAHVRFNERTDADGKRVLFVEEFQSDWAQKGKREGFIDPTRATHLAEIQSEMERLAKDRLPSNVMVEERRWHRLADEAASMRATSTVPKAPFVGKTEAWVALALKRMIRYAADNGFDRIAWTNGEQQADRYDLSKHIDSLRYMKQGEAYVLTATLHGNGREQNLGVHESDKLDDVVGKDVAAKIRAGEGRDAFGQKEISGLDLKVGGEGMVAFYDKIVPNVANDVLKKLGGGRVGTVMIADQSTIEDEFGSEENQDGEERAGRTFQTVGEQLGFDITPALRERASQGVPMFARASMSEPLEPSPPREPAPKPSSGRENLPEWLANATADLKSAAAKVDTYAPDKSIADKIGELKANWKERLVQGLFDAYAPLKRLGPTEYVKARMVKSVDGALEGMLLYGKPVMGEDGAISGDIDKKGFLGAMKELKGEHDRFFLWVAGNRADSLMAQDREHLFTRAEISAMKDLDSGKMADGTSRKVAFMKAAETLRSYNRAVLDIAEKTGLIDGESRHLWEHDFYVPFFRVGEDMKIEGPSAKVKGLVRQQAFKKLKGGEENLGDLMENTLRNWSHLLSASMANQAAVASLKAAVRVGVAEEVSAETKGATYAMVAGKKTHFEVSDPFILSAISAMESASFKGLPMEVMGKFKHYLTLGVTVSPTFRIRNLMRDSISAIGQNEMSYNVMANLAQGFKGTDRKSEDYAQMLFNGALMRFGQLTDGKHAEHAKRLVMAGVDDSTILTNPEKVKNALGKIWDEYQEFGDRLENVNRTALYRQMKAAGKSDIEAAFAARDMMDFSLQGSWTAVRFLTQIVPFMNARLQGLYKLGRSGKENPARLGYVLGAVSLASIALMLAYGDDDEWKKREDWDRDNFWWFKIGNTAFRIPKPFEIGAIGTLAERSVEMMISDEMTGKRFAERLKAMVGDTLALNPVPQLFKPMIDLYANEDSFSGRQIESRGMENLSKSERMTPYTSLVAKIIGKAGGVTGVSPVQADHLIRAYFGWLGSHVAMSVDMMAQPFMDTTKPARKIGDYIVVGDFVKDLPADRSRYVEQFYKQAKEVHEVMGDIRQAREAGDLERAREIIESHRGEVATSKLYGSAERRIGEINKQIRMVQLSRGAPDEKRARLDRLTAMRNALARNVEVMATRTREAARR